MSALGKRVLDLAEQQGLLDGKAIVELRTKVAESKFVITPEAIAKVLVDHGHLTPYQARRLVAQAQGDAPDPIEQKFVERAKTKSPPKIEEDLVLAEDAPAARRPTPPHREEIVELEAVQPADNTRGPAGHKNAPAQADSEGATADDFVDLEPVDRTPQVRGQRWKTDPQPLSETIEMSPLEVPASPGDVVDLEPIDDLFSPEPLPSVPSAPRPVKAEKPVTAAPPAAANLDLFGPPSPAVPSRPVASGLPRRAAKNVWDSPLLLIGGGVFGVVLVVFLLLLYALTRGSAAQMFAKAEEEYSQGAFPAAIAIYNQFLEKYPQDANASLARVRRGIATLRQITEDGKSPRLGLETAQQVLPQIESEAEFGEARAELATILPSLAEGVASQAVQADDPARKQDWVKLATEALALVNNPSYLPASLRKDRENQIARIVDQLKVAERGIEQDRRLAETIKAILAAADQGKASDGYTARAQLLKQYPALETNPDLLAAVAKVGLRERELVKTTQGGPQPFKDDHSSPATSVLLTTTPQIAPADALPACTLVAGAVYGFDAKSGAILWRRHIGQEATIQPISVSSNGQPAVAAIDAQRHELVLVSATTGQLLWRHPLGGPIVGLLADNLGVVVVTRAGRVTSFAANSGEIVASSQLPQGAVVGPAVGQSLLFQLGEHSTLFVLDRASLSCKQTVYLGHKAGQLLVPPAFVTGQTLFIDSPTDDLTLIHSLVQDGKTKEWKLAPQPKRLKGRVVTPVVVSGNRLAITTDLGQIAVFQAEGGAGEPLRALAGAAAAESTPLTTYAELDKNRLFIAGRRRTMFEVQESLQQLALKWTENQDDRFVAPLSLHGDILVAARRRTDATNVQLEACSATTGKALWTTPLADSLADLIHTADESLVALTGSGRVYDLTPAAFTAGRAVNLDLAPIQRVADPGPSFDGKQLVWSPVAGNLAFVYDTAARSSVRSIDLPAAAAALVTILNRGIVAPLVDGRVLWLSADQSPASSATFLPPLVPASLPRWQQPLPLPDGLGFLLSDGRNSVYAVRAQAKNQSRLQKAGEFNSPGPISSLVWAGDTAIGVASLATSDVILGLDARAQPRFDPVPLAGRVLAGPYSVGGLAFVFAEPDGLVCCNSEGQLKWKQPQSRGPLAGRPLPLPAGDVLLAYQSGDCCRIDPATGQERAHVSLGEPLLGAPVVVNANVYLSGSDSVVHRVTLSSLSQ